MSSGRYGIPQPDGTTKYYDNVSDFKAAIRGETTTTKPSTTTTTSIRNIKGPPSISTTTSVPKDISDRRPAADQKPDQRVKAKPKKDTPISPLPPIKKIKGGAAAREKAAQAITDMPKRTTPRKKGK